MSKELRGIIFVEGVSDQNILKNLMNKYFNIKFDQETIKENEKRFLYKYNQELILLETDGVKNMQPAIKRQIQNFNKNDNVVKKVFIITDADKSKQSAEQSVKDITDKCKDTGVQFAHHIITRPSKDYGIMEDLFLDIVVNLTDDFYQKNTIMQLVSDVRNDVDKDAAKHYYSRKVKAATTSFVRFYNCYTDVDKNDIITLMEQDDGIAKKLMEYDTIKEMLAKIGEHFSLEQASN